MSAMPLRMFRLTPGQSARYLVRPVGGGDRPELSLTVVRPDEGPSSQLQLELFDPCGGLVDVGRVPLDQGFLAVLREVKNQLHSVSKWRENKEFDLVADEADPAEGQMHA